MCVGTTDCDNLMCYVNLKWAKVGSFPLGWLVDTMDIDHIIWSACQTDRFAQRTVCPLQDSLAHVLAPTSPMSSNMECLFLVVSSANVLLLAASCLQSIQCYFWQVGPMAGCWFLIEWLVAGWYCGSGQDSKIRQEAWLGVGHKKDISSFMHAWHSVQRCVDVYEGFIGMTRSSHDSKMLVPCACGHRRVLSCTETRNGMIAMPLLWAVCYREMFCLMALWRKQLWMAITLFLFS